MTLSPIPRDQRNDIERKWKEELREAVNMKSSTLFQVLAQTGVSGAAESTLLTYSVQRNRLGLDGDSIRASLAGTFANTGANKTIKAKFGATTFFDSGAMAITTAEKWVLMIEIIRTAAATQRCLATLITTDSALPADCAYATAAETLSAAVNLVITGQGGADDDVTIEMGKGQFVSCVC